MKIQLLALCAIVAFGVGESVQAQPAAAPGTANAGALGNAQAVDETTLSLDARAPAANTAAVPAGPNTFVYFLRMILVLALVVGAMYLVFMLMRRIARPRQTEDSPIRVMASTSLGAGKSLHLVGLGSKAWLVGSSEQGVNLVAEIDDKELLDGIALDATQSKPSAGGDFGSILTGLLAPKTSRKKSTSTGGRGSAFDVGHLARQRDRLSKFRGDEK